MSALLDTHAFLWWVTDSPDLSGPARKIIADEDNAIFVSAASAWEIATKVRLGKLSGVPGVVDRFGELVAADGFRHLPASYLHALRSGGYGVAQKDPFDRMLAAQSEIERLPLITRDPAFSLFGIETIW
ncbi:MULTISPECIES: type II toxin-antitoxin system VapC family toxin [Thiorhodovibrio]|uniref:type II toxin-antitoxin system VapC family toxin n=1 Tax=Thiorhodovibrio TaxID=61593 RepID=UPI00191131D1|nr:type II toxin-antitoxin system VapC family toxin [Thiorhodovibrio litoralis]MBK5970975.1 PIN domain nuclease [Thiorhodovibrio winogradskyi]WPL10658.1 PIN domain protein [Thiorhodovibrio litoralis]